MSPAHPFIKSRVADLRKQIDADLFAWVSGKKHPNLEFSGSLPLVFWNNILNDFVARITDAAFVAAREIAEKNGIDSMAAVRSASSIAKDEARALIDKMVDYDRKMRGKGFPKSVPAKDVSSEIKKSLDFIDERESAEVGIISETVKTRMAENTESWSLDRRLVVIGIVISLIGVYLALK